MESNLESLERRINILESHNNVDERLGAVEGKVAVLLAFNTITMGAIVAIALALVHII
jgi:hypothetical protein